MPIIYITFATKRIHMKLRIIFCWAGNVYNWYGRWPFPCVPCTGNTISIQSFIEKGHVRAEVPHDIVFCGCGRYLGLEVSLQGMLFNDYNTKVVSVNWVGEGMEIYVTTDIFAQKDHLGIDLWEEK